MGITGKFQFYAVLASIVVLPVISSAEDTATSADTDALVPIEIKLPEPFYGGTPLPYWSEHLEPKDYRDRPPFLAPQGATNVAVGKTVTSSVPPLHGALKQITDGDKHYAKTSRVELPEGVQWIQVDLGNEHDIYAVQMWHFHEGDQVYFDIIVQISNDKQFKEGVTTIYNNDHDNSAGLGAGKDREYIETNVGRLMDAKGISGRYVRCYSRGNTADDFNHYIEVEVYGKAKAS